MLPFEQLRSEMTRTSIMGPSPVTLDTPILERRGGRFLPDVDSSRLELDRLIAISHQLGRVGTLDIGLYLPTSVQLERINFDEELGCWLLPAYQDMKNRARYGSLSVSGIPGSLAHRTMYLAFFGPDSLPGGRHDFLDHICERKPCCYPRHLERVNQRQNTRRGASRATDTDPRLAIWQPPQTLK